MLNISVLGDSISTFEGYNPEGFAVYYDTFMQQRNDLSSVNDTWWAQVILALGGQLCVNNSFSGSKVCGDSFPSASSEIRCSGLHTAQELPDIILLYIGDNDFGYGMPVQRKRFSLKRDPAFFADAYDCMLDRLTHNYPNAAIIYATLMRTMIRNSDWVLPECFCGVPFDDYNNAIRKVKRKKNCYMADLPDIRYETPDGSHPTKYGHQVIADAWIQTLIRLGFIAG